MYIAFYKYKCRNGKEFFSSDMVQTVTLLKFNKFKQIVLKLSVFRCRQKSTQG